MNFEWQVDDLMRVIKELMSNPKYYQVTRLLPLAATFQMPMVEHIKARKKYYHHFPDEIFKFTTNENHIWIKLYRSFFLRDQ